MELTDSSLRSLRNFNREEYLTQRSQRYAEIAEKTSNPDSDYFRAKQG
jgi:hypothetical protein